MSKTAFIGHRQIFAKTLNERLANAVTNEIQNGCTNFTMGTHGQFDNLALYTCRLLRRQYNDIDIEVVITSLNRLKKDFSTIIYSEPYEDVKTIMYDIESTHFKRQIILSNQRMIDECDTLICYVDEKAYRSGAKIALQYAKKKRLKIINLFREEDILFTAEDFDKKWNTIYKEQLQNK